MLTFVLGGARSGKTKWALRYGESLSNFKEFYYIATAQPFDEEMRHRIKRHQEERSKIWQVLEEPVEIPKLLKKYWEKDCVILLDCLTLWLTNLILNSKKIDVYFEEFLDALIPYREQERTWLIIIANEVGLGIVPETKLGREFRDYAGLLNQEVALRADEVYFIIAGLSIALKGHFVGTNPGYLS